MSNYFTIEIALDSSSHKYEENKYFLLTRLPTIGCEDWYSFHDIQRIHRKIIYKELFCIRLCNVDTVIQLISLVKRVTGIYIECIYTNNQIVYASNHYTKLMHKDKVKELKQRTKNTDEKRIITTLN